jgi:hypothetical protein
MMPVAAPSPPPEPAPLPLWSNPEPSDDGSSEAT